MNRLKEFIQHLMRRGDIGVGWVCFRFTAPGALLVLLVCSRMAVAAMRWNYPWRDCNVAVHQFVSICDLGVMLGCYALGWFSLRRLSVLEGKPRSDASWISTTPFAEKQFLSGPLFPALPVDLLAVGIVMATIYLAGVAPAILMLVGYLAGVLSNVCRLFVMSGDVWGGLVASLVLALLPTVILAVGWIPGLGVLVAAILAVGYSIRLTHQTEVAARWRTLDNPPHRSWRAWPYCEFFPETPSELILPTPKLAWMQAMVGASMALSISLLLDWGDRVYASVHQNPREDTPAVLAWMLWMIALHVLVAARLGIFLLRGSPAASLSCRWMQREGISPSYDIVFLTPLAMSAVGWLGAIATNYVASNVVLPMNVLCVMLLNGYGPPDWRTWTLTAPLNIENPTTFGSKEQPYQQL